MEGYHTEEEQVKAIKQWIKKNGSSTLTLIIIGVVLSLGWRYWNHHRDVVKQNASIQFELLLNQLNTETALKQKSEIKEDVPAENLFQAKKLIKEYPRTPYASLAALLQVRDAIESKNWREAEKQLRWVLNNSRDNEIIHIARVRLARILIEQKDYEQALKVLDVDKSNGYKTLYDELKGDIYIAQENVDEARKAYQAAIQSSPFGENTRPLLKMKLDDLALNEPDTSTIELKNQSQTTK